MKPEVKKSPVLLGVNIDHVATLREVRGMRYPDPVYAALLAEQAGADSITAHLREDRRHIQDRDIELLQGSLQTRLNLEMAVTEEMIGIAERLQPMHCCFVPESREELTTEGGLDVAGQKTKITAACERLAAAGVCVSLFIDPDLNQIEAAKQTGAAAIEIHTGQYAEAIHPEEIKAHLHHIEAAVQRGLDSNLIVNAGHGLHYHNVQAIAAILGINELNIGHGIVAFAVYEGMNTAIKKMKQLLNTAR